MPLHISYSGIGTFLDCELMYAWRYVRRLERIKFEPSNILGRVVHFGVNQIYARNKNVMKDTLKYFDKQKQDERGKLALKIESEQELNEQEFIVKGLLPAYEKVYKKHIEKTKEHQAEYAFDFNFNKNVILHCQIDNLIEQKKHLFLHELKTSKFLTSDYIQNIKNDLQTAIYFHAYNKVHKNKLHGILYDVIKKPSIRQKKKESTQEFVKRLYQYYVTSDNELFYMEEINEPLLSEDRVFGIIQKVTDKILKYDMKMENFCPNERFCYVYRRCDFYPICHEGENKETLANYRKRENQNEKGKTINKK